MQKNEIIHSIRETARQVMPSQCIKIFFIRFSGSWGCTS